MAKIGFLSHSDMSIYYFRAPIMRELKKLGHEVIAIEPYGAYTKPIQEEFKTIIYEIDKASLNPLKVKKDTQNLASILSTLNLDMLQTAAHKSNVFGTIAAKKAGIKVVLNLVEGLGSFYIDNDIKSKIVRFTIEMLYKKSFALSNGTIFVNDSDPDYMIKHNIIKKDKVKRIKSVGVDANEFNPNLVTKYDFKTDKKIVLMMGRALWHKGIREFYEAAKILKDRSDTKFVFVGDGYEGNKSSADKSFLNNQNVLWIKWSDRVKELLKGTYIYVLPSYKEGFPRTVLEAMSMSLPCVVSNVSGCNEAIKDGYNGMICNVKDSKDLANKIETLLDDENLAKQMGQNGRNLVLEKYDQNIITKQYIEYYRNFLDV
ncbi:MAG: N,N'-diacetylbacillosaminyl-diphospho-undecaprenol alpha-1,3-N-acetylgalactosaminyltransferase [Campylobacter sputorum]|uniref:N, N'-diacetylbacillosaminyl-diphospho-undecaprenol alpha-1,3-N-acetylgalactosaminyltransferase n=1 Tax=Campylobacter sputorum TaxID=206 RepID=UPI000B776D7E|nr:N,N'-diacetylbacillosaminyl-diphospho-undecaprenol alpha-1,3-N-acetylgalactosaminyltransferase [Campylobacter sputorum]ASM38454.1 N,N'-diacetylbacillosaminyl-diphospho-undecaprenol alpha-1,3-N-acetylgalactosaminyltransferase [Campylobacter sputorum bv. paraureolyticus LMG 11764]MDY6120735.1 N,N'-diacetylbacillosaminyl-diphospho-undecaprenol alpha-1,3-N-acetylgalactosaminyltransferase [Campylobacter sputorum]